MFKSARVQLTFFYLIAIVFVSSLTTFGIRIVAQNAFEHQNSDTRNEISSLIREQVGIPLFISPLQKIQQEHDADAQKQLLEWTVYFNILAIIIGGPISYWFAGRTLKPIEDAHKLQAKFASDASHELNTPLSVMKTENEVFLRQKSFTETEARNQIVSNLEEVQRLELLTNNLLALSDFTQHGKIKLSSIKSAEVANHAVSQFSKTYSINDRIEASIDNHKIFGNLESLSQIIVIFLDNALKYSPKNSKIHLIGKRHKNNFVFSVVDNGPGIARKDMPLIFERLYRSDMSRSSKIPGHGLGLALAKEIANANQAGLSVSNNADKGATFNLIVNLTKQI
ncbi:MAG TPA: ATP-binding protein [Candidatus Dormibacteraeota bacterium]|nr:ATP-binding protein [Candidatus Dormibacteraeota bacterium]